ncbi:BamA/TamA family outer membrane protein [Aquicoccus sp. SCR17]|nr:BamA/TamA family outer membrane protein [Carideicomes alvinocaridis]
MPDYRITSRLAAVFISLFIALPAAAETRIVLAIPGQYDDLADRIGNALDTRATVQEEDYTPQDVLAAAQADYRRVVTALYESGYYGPEVSIRLDGREASEFQPFSQPGPFSEVRVTVYPGPRFVFGTTRLGPLPRGTQKPERLRSGEPAGVPAIRSSAQEGVDAWRDIGFAKAEIARQQITADHRNSRVDVDLGIAPGRRLTFGDLNITGIRRMRPERVREIAGLPSGSVFSPEEVERAATRLRRTGVFRTVSLEEAETAGPDATLDINAELAERKPRRIGVGAEYASVDGGRLSAFWLHRNLFGGAERLRVEGEVSGIDSGLGGVDYSLGATLTRPGTFNPDNDLTFRLGYEFIDDPAYNSERAEAEVSLLRRVNDEITVSYGLGLLAERVQDSFGERDLRLVTLPLTGEFDKRDDDLDARNGYYLASKVTPFAGLAGTGSGAHLTFDARGYRSFGEDDRVTLAGRLQLGSLVGPEIQNAPTDFLFFSGGGGTVRGQPYQSLGVERGGTTVGGRSFIGLSAELRAHATKKLSVVGFYDAGFIGADSMPGDDGDWHSGTGFGLRYDTGLGPVRVDVATPASGDDAFGEVAFYVGLGQSF